MKLQDVLDLVANSLPDDWRGLETQVVGRWEQFRIGDEWNWRPVLHSHVMTLKNDARISIAFGAELNNSFEEAWTKNFYDEHAKSVLMSIRLSGVTVLEKTVVVVDGSRFPVVLPEPTESGFEIQGRDLKLGRLVFELFSGETHRSLDDCLANTGVRLVE